MGYQNLPWPKSDELENSPGSGSTTSSTSWQTEICTLPGFGLRTVPWLVLEQSGWSMLISSSESNDGERISVRWAERGTMLWGKMVADVGSSRICPNLNSRNTRHAMMFWRATLKTATVARTSGAESPESVIVTTLMFMASVVLVRMSASRWNRILRLLFTCSRAVPSEVTISQRVLSHWQR